MRDIRSRFSLRFLAACALALAVGGPHLQAAAHAAAHALERTGVHSHDGTTHRHGHDGDMHHHGGAEADASPAAMRAPTVRPRAGDGERVHALCADASASAAAEVASAAASKPPPRPARLLLSRRLADRAPPA